MPVPPIEDQAKPYHLETDSCTDMCTDICTNICTSWHDGKALVRDHGRPIHRLHGGSISAAYSRGTGGIFLYTGSVLALDRLYIGLYASMYRLFIGSVLALYRIDVGGSMHVYTDLYISYQ